MAPRPPLLPDEEEEEEEEENFPSSLLLLRHPVPSSSSSGSGGLAPSKSTIYASNLDYSLTNSDLHTLFSPFGRIARVTVLKHPLTRLSRGVAFILFVSRSAASSAVRSMHGRILNGRTISVSVAHDNGRAPEFIRRRVYRDKSRCYECGAEGHLSYECPRNVLGPRERPEGKRRRGGREVRAEKEEEEEEEEVGFEEDKWASVVDARGEEEREEGGRRRRKKKKKGRRLSYFSDESGEDDDDDDE